MRIIRGKIGCRVRYPRGAKRGVIYTLVGVDRLRYRQTCESPAPYRGGGGVDREGRMGRRVVKRVSLIWTVVAAALVAIVFAIIPLGVGAQTTASPSAASATAGAASATAGAASSTAGAASSTARSASSTAGAAGAPTGASATSSAASATSVAANATATAANAAATAAFAAVSRGSAVATGTGGGSAVVPVVTGVSGGSATAASTATRAPSAVVPLATGVGGGGATATHGPGGDVNTSGNRDHGSNRDACPHSDHSADARSDGDHSCDARGNGDDSGGSDGYRWWQHDGPAGDG